MSRELDHIIIQRIDKGGEWAVEYISHTPPILKHGRIIATEVDKIIYQSKKEYPTAEERERPLPTVAEEPTDFE